MLLGPWTTTSEFLGEICRLETFYLFVLNAFLGKLWRDLRQGAGND
jgi:hypothetical protein